MVQRMQRGVELERQRGSMWKNRESEVWHMWRKECGNMKGKEEQERGSFLSALQDRKENVMVELG